MCPGILIAVHHVLDLWGGRGLFKAGRLPSSRTGTAWCGPFYQVFDITGVNMDPPVSPHYERYVGISVITLRLGCVCRAVWVITGWGFPRPLR